MQNLKNLISGAEPAPEEKEENPKYKIDKKSAELEFEKFCSDWDIDTDIDDLDSEDKENFKNLKKRILRKIMSGNLVYIEADETFSYTLIKPIDKAPDSKTIIIYRTKGQANMVMDNYKDSETIHKVYAKLAAMVKMPPAFIAKMDEVDLKILQGIQTLFFFS